VEYLPQVNGDLEIINGHFYHYKAPISVFDSDES
jgi:hypothetical protein